MEIGHNVMHGQWDWMNDPDIHSSTWDWDTASTKEAWKHSHNYVHHTYTNIRGKDKDLGYEIMRIDPHQKWHPVYLAQPLYNLLLMAFFEWGVAFHDLDLEARAQGREVPQGGPPGAQGHRRQGAQADRQGLRRLPADLPGSSRAPSPPRPVARQAAKRRGLAGVPRDAQGQRDGQHRPQRVVARDHLLRPLPRPDVHVRARTRSRTSRAAACTSASCSARPTSRARRSST